MNRAKPALLLCAALVTSACASRALDDHYYSLVLAADQTIAAHGNETAQHHLVVGPIQLPAYLNQRGLVMQTGSNQVRAANHHFWAEPLEEAIAKVLVGDLSRRFENATVDRDAGRWTVNGNCRVRVEFDRFHATNASRVVSSGRYWLLSDDNASKYEFEFSQKLTIGGYGHAVDALRASLALLSEQMSESIDIRSQCPIV